MNVWKTFELLTQASVINSSKGTLVARPIPSAKTELCTSLQHLRLMASRTKKALTEEKNEDKERAAQGISSTS